LGGPTVKCPSGCSRAKPEDARELRAQLGCDAPVVGGVKRRGAFWTPCWRCAETCDESRKPDGVELGAPGATCHSGQAWFKRCPTYYMDRAPWVWGVLQGLRMWKRGVLPREGGYLDQSPAFLDAVESLLAHQGRLERMNAER
jgi:hypothetical protein